jgi:hypothetical protein
MRKCSDVLGKLSVSQFIEILELLDSKLLLFNVRSEKN